jgi:hypothetical protein
MPRPPLRSDIADAVARVAGCTRGFGRERRALVRHLVPDETVLLVSGGRYEGRAGLVTLTDRRLLFIAEGWIIRYTADFPDARIGLVSWRSGLGAGELILTIDGVKQSFTSVVTAVGSGIADGLRERLAAADAKVAAAVAQQDELYAMVERLYAARFPEPSPGRRERGWGLVDEDMGYPVPAQERPGFTHPTGYAEPAGLH